MTGNQHLPMLFPAPWDKDLADLIEDGIRNGAEANRLPLLEALFTAMQERGETLAWALIQDPTASQGMKDETYALVFAQGNLQARQRVAGEIFTAGNGVGRAVTKILAAALDFRFPGFTQRLEDQELADLYAWLGKEFPTTDDEQPHGTDRGNMARLRNDLLVNLTRRGSPETASAMQSLVDAFPQWGFLRQLHRDAVDRAATATWRPPTIPELLALARNREKRFVDRAEDLQAAILESLERFDRDLTQSETPMIEFLWNDCRKCKPRFTPKDEGALSNLVKRHLEVDLAGRSIVVNREVEVVRAPSGTGQRTDIHVRAAPAGATADDARRLTVVLETKRCFNPDRPTSLKAQLVEQYLKPLGLACGIYLVARFDCEAFKACCGTEKESQLRTKLRRQASAVGPEYKVVPVVLAAGLPYTAPRRTPSKKGRAAASSKGRPKRKARS